MDETDEEQNRDGDDNFDDFVFEGSDGDEADESQMEVNSEQSLTSVTRKRSSPVSSPSQSDSPRKRHCGEFKNKDEENRSDDHDNQEEEDYQKISEEDGAKLLEGIQVGEQVNFPNSGFPRTLQCSDNYHTVSSFRTSLPSSAGQIESITSFQAGGILKNIPLNARIYQLKFCMDNSLSKNKLLPRVVVEVLTTISRNCYWPRDFD